jgi:hypothetical protein
MWGEGIFKQDALIGQPFHRGRLAKGVAIKMAGGGLLLVGHNEEDIGLIGHHYRLG